MARKRRPNDKTRVNALDQISADFHGSFGRPAHEVEAIDSVVTRRQKRRTMTARQRQRADHDARRVTRVHVPLPAATFAAFEAEAEALSVPRYNLVQYRVIDGLLRFAAANIDLRTHRVAARGPVALRYDYEMAVPMVDAGDTLPDQRHLYALTPRLYELIRTLADRLGVPMGNLVAFLLVSSLQAARAEGIDLRPELVMACGGTAVRYDFVLPLPSLPRRTDEILLAAMRDDGAETPDEPWSAI